MKGASNDFNWGNVDVGAPSECWPWKRFVKPTGYGMCKWRGKVRNASRAAYEAVNGPVPDGLVVCHTCDNPPCCNPSHLFAATMAVNNADCRAKGRHRAPSGASHHRSQAKLTVEMVAEAKRLHKCGISQVEISRRFGVSAATVSRLIAGKQWGHVKPATSLLVADSADKCKAACEADRG